MKRQRLGLRSAVWVGRFTANEYTSDKFTVNELTSDKFTGNEYTSDKFTGNEFKVKFTSGRHAHEQHIFFPKDIFLGPV